MNGGGDFETTAQVHDKIRQDGLRGNWDFKVVFEMVLEAWIVREPPP